MAGGPGGGALTPRALADLYRGAVKRLIEAVSSSRIEVNLTDVLRCKRLFYFERVAPRDRVKPDVSIAGRVSMVTIFGTLVHELLEIPWCAKEVEMRLCFNGACLVAKPDFWCPERREVIEVKTVARLAGIPRLNHLAQLRTYMWLLGAERGTLVYISRTTGEVRTFEVTGAPPRGAIDALVERLFGFVELVKGGGPAPPPEPGVWCRNCPYRFMCRVKLEEAEVGEGELVRLLKMLAGKA